MSKSNSVKILDDALKIYKDINDLQFALAQKGIRITTSALYKAKRGETKEFSDPIKLALCDLIYDGDGNRLKEAMEADIKKK